jgi:hypothetical protein
MSPAAREAMLFEDVAKRRKRVWRRLGGKVAWIWLEMRSKAYWTSEGLAPVTFPLAPLPTLNQDAANDVTVIDNNKDGHVEDRLVRGHSTQGSPVA